MSSAENMIMRGPDDAIKIIVTIVIIVTNIGTSHRYRYCVNRSK